MASKLKERLHRPAIAFAPVEPGGAALRGSARSIPGFHVRDALALVDARHPGLIDRFGGHAMAAGLSLQVEAFPAFCDAFLQVASDWLTDDLLTDVLRSDGALADADSTSTPRWPCAMAAIGGRAMPSRCSTASSTCWLGASSANATSSWNWARAENA